MQKKLAACAAIINDRDFEVIELSLREPNIFRALSIERKEIRHSNFIAYILDPRENHGLKDIVLRKVLRDIFSESKISSRSIFDADDMDLQHIEIRREWRNIDILIILKDDIVLIENKVDSIDHSNQLKGYHRIAEESFPDKCKHYVYLTPFGSDPQDVDFAEIYTNYSYIQIADIVETILSLYRNSISQKIAFYLSDYLTTVRRELLMNDKLNEMAIKVYNAHKEAFDFIFDNRPDPSSILYPYFEKELIDAGFLIGSQNKGYIRFTTPELAAILPRCGQYLQNKELFTFEIDYFWTGKFGVFRAFIAPSDDKKRDDLHLIVKESKYYKSPAGKKWLVFHMNKYSFVAADIINEDETDIQMKVKNIIEDVKPVVTEISETILRNYKL